MGRNTSDFEKGKVPLTFSPTVTTSFGRANRGYGPEIKSHSLTAHLEDGTHVGLLNWDASSGEIKDIAVHPEYRRLGIATAMLDEASTRASTEGITVPTTSRSRTLLGDKLAKGLAEKRGIWVKSRKNTERISNEWN